jgi:hypothetical protein
MPERQFIRRSGIFLKSAVNTEKLARLLNVDEENEVCCYEEANGQFPFAFYSVISNLDNK